MNDTKQTKWADSKFVIDCPKKLKKRMYKNLHDASNNIITSKRTKRAKDILASLKKQPEKNA